MKIIVAGDLCPQNRVSKIISDKCQIKKYFSSTKDVLLEADFSIVNLECPIVDDNKVSPIIKEGPALKASSKVIDLLHYCGFNAVTLANNHIYDYGVYGLKNTLEICDESGIKTVGARISPNDIEETLDVQISNESLAIINICEHEFSVTENKNASANPLDLIDLYYTIKRAKEQNDYVVVIVHGGPEHWQYPTERMVKTYRLIVDWGADAVVNHHQHCYSGYEIYNGSPIFYGIGNFCFDNPMYDNANWNKGYLVKLNLSTNGHSFNLIPYIQCSHDSIIKYLNQDTYKDSIITINNNIGNKSKQEELEDNYYKQTTDWYLDFIRPYNNRYIMWLKRHKLLPRFYSTKWASRAYSIIHCESHREKLLFQLRNLINCQ